MSELNLVVLAAGIGSRYGGLKQMDPIGPSGEFIIDYSVFDAVRAGFNVVTFVIRPDIEADFRETIGRRVEAHVEVRYAFQTLDQVPASFSVPPGRSKPWGTGHALLCASEQVRGPFAVINADDFYGAQAYSILAEHLRAAGPPGTYCMVGFELARTLSAGGTVSRGICEVDADGRLVTVRETHEIGGRPDAVTCPECTLSGRELASMNCWGFQPEVLDRMRSDFATFLAAHGGEEKSEFYIPKVVDDGIAAGAVTVRVLPTTAQWLGVTHPEDRSPVVAAVQALVDSGVYPTPLWNA